MTQITEQFRPEYARLLCTMCTTENVGMGIPNKILLFEGRGVRQQSAN